MTELLTAVAILFLAAGLFLLAGDRLGVPTAPMLILAGVSVGLVIPELLGVELVEEGSTLTLAQVGIALLVFTFGADLEFGAVRTVLGDSEVAAIVGAVVMGGLGVGAGVGLGLDLQQAAYVGVAAALSSTLVGTSLLQTEIRANLVRGRLAESIHLVQDLLAVGILLVLGAGTLSPDPIATQLGYGIGLILVALLVNRLVFGLLESLAGDSDEPLIVGVVALLVVFMSGAELVGVSVVVGAFAAGLAVQREPARHIGLLNGLESIKDFFLALFFVTVGALVAVPTLEVVAIAATLTVLTALVKPAVTIAVLSGQGYEGRSATLTGLNLDQVSEFSLIIAIEALLLGLIAQSVFDAIILAAALTMVTSSLTSQYGERLFEVLSDRGLVGSGHGKVDQRSDVPDDLDDHTVIVGYGRQGRRLARTCEQLDRSYVVIENDPALLAELERTCEAYVFGDATESYTLEKSQVGRASLVVSTVETATISRRLLAAADDADVVLRAGDGSTAAALMEAGATYVSVADALAAERLLGYIESLGDGEVSAEQLKERHLAELDTGRSGRFHTTADEIRARR